MEKALNHRGISLTTTGLARRRMMCRMAVAMALALGTAAGVAAAQTFTTLDDPLASGPYGGTIASGISGNNIVGSYYNSSGEDHGFLYNGSSYTTLDDPLAVYGTIASGISGNNIVGNETGT